MATRNVLYVPLGEVTSSFLNLLQNIFTQRANGASNTLAATLDTASTAHNITNLAFSLNFAAIAAFETIDSSIDWRDRRLTVTVLFDQWKDIRPGEAQDNVQAKWRGQRVVYTQGGNMSFTTSAPLELQVTALGALQVKKSAGYAFVEISASCMLKERT